MDDDVYAPQEFEGVPYDDPGEGRPAESREDLEEGEEGEEVEDGESEDVCSAILWHVVVLTSCQEDITFITDEKKASKEGTLYAFLISCSLLEMIFVDF